MLLPLMLAEVSLLAAPLYLDETPELRSVQHILIVHEDVEGASSSVRLTREAAVEQALDLGGGEVVAKSSDQSIGTATAADRK